MDSSWRGAPIFLCVVFVQILFFLLVDFDWRVSCKKRGGTVECSRCPAAVGGWASAIGRQEG